MQGGKITGVTLAKLNHIGLSKKIQFYFKTAIEMLLTLSRSSLVFPHRVNRTARA